MKVNNMSNLPLVLYVEDNPDNRKLVSRLLTAYDFNVEVVSDGPESLDFVQNYKPDLILLDINMPGMDGYSVIEQMRQIKHLQDVPIIALTANVMKGDKEKSLEAGFNGYIQKPINVDDFPTQVMSFISSS